MTRQNRGFCMSPEAGGGPGAMSVVVVSYNTKALTIQCVEALRTHAPRGTQVCVVDNASSDGSGPALEEVAFRSEGTVRVICSDLNRGFGAANNLGAASTTGEFIALVNSDAFVREGVLEGLRTYLERTPRAAVAGPRLENADGSFQESRFDFPSPFRAWLENLGLNRLQRLLSGRRRRAAGPVHWLSGAFLLVRREVWEKAGGFDEAFFLYAEETDLQRRIAAMGWEIHWTPQFVVTHIGGSSGLAERDVVRERFFEGADRYVLRYHGRAGARMFRAATVCGALLRWFWYAVTSGCSGPRTRQWGWVVRRQILKPFPKESGCATGSETAPHHLPTDRREQRAPV